MPYYDTDLTDRAVEAFFNEHEKAGTTPMQPNRYDTEQIGNTIYIRSGEYLLGKYRVRNSGLQETLQKVS